MISFSHAVEVCFSSFEERWREHNQKIKHILARINHPETNGKLERLNYTIKRLRPYFTTWEVQYGYE